MQTGKVRQTLSSGIIIGINILIISLSIASITFGGAAVNYIGLGFYSCLIASLIIITINVLRSQFAFMVAGASINYAMIMAGVISTIVISAPHTDKHVVMATIMAAIVLTSFWLGLCLLFISQFRLTAIARFFPYSVNQGYLGGIALLVILTMILNILHVPSLLDIVKKPEMILSPSLLLATAYGVIAFVLNRFFNRSVILFSIFILSSLVFYGLVYLFNIDIHFLIQKGYLISFSHSILNPFQLPLSSVKMIDWSLLGHFWPDYAILTILMLLSVLMKLSNLQLLSEESIDTNKEIQSFAWGDIIAAMLGGFANEVYMGNILNTKNIGKTRVVGAITVLFLLIAIFNIQFMEYIPLFVLQGTILYICLTICYSNLIKPYSSSNKYEHLGSIIIAIIMAFYNILFAVFLGLIFSLIFFFIRYQKVSTIKQITDARYLSSYVERSDIETNLLEKIGNQILIVRLQSYIFFGNTVTTFEKINESITEYQSHPLKIVIIDFSAIDGIEPLVSYDLEKLLNRLSSIDVPLCCSNMPLKIRRYLQQLIANKKMNEYLGLFDDLNLALEYSENICLNEIAPFKDMTASQRLISLFGDEYLYKYLINHAEKIELEEGDLLIKENENANGLYLVKSGELKVVKNHRTAQAQTVKKILAGAIVGELGYFLNIPRTASVVASTDTHIIHVNKAVLDLMQKKEPDLIQSLQTMVIKLLSKRLIYCFSQQQK